MRLTPQQEMQQKAEMMRNKGLLCPQFFQGASCNRSNCPYMHVVDGETRPIPEAPCQFFLTSVCLREKCKFFHGTQEALDALRTSQQTMYRPQDYMEVAATGVVGSLSSSNSTMGLSGDVHSMQAHANHSRCRDRPQQHVQNSRHPAAVQRGSFQSGGAFAAMPATHYVQMAPHPGYASMMPPPQPQQLLHTGVGSSGSQFQLPTLAFPSSPLQQSQFLEAQPGSPNTHGYLVPYDNNFSPTLRPSFVPQAPQHGFMVAPPSPQYVHVYPHQEGHAFPGVLPLVTHSNPPPQLQHNHQHQQSFEMHQNLALQPWAGMQAHLMGPQGAYYLQP